MVGHIPSVARVLVQQRLAGVPFGIARVVDRLPVERVVGDQIIEQRFAIPLGIRLGIAPEVLRDLPADEQ